MNARVVVFSGFLLATLHLTTATALAAPIKARTCRATPTGVYLSVEITLPDKSPIVLKIEDGALGRITVDGRTYGVVPVTGTSLQAIDVIVHEITSNESGDESLIEIERTVCGPAQKATSPKLPFRVRILALTFDDPSTDSAAQRIGVEPNLPCEQCCVTCQGIVSCACAVQTACG